LIALGVNIYGGYYDPRTGMFMPDLPGDYVPPTVGSPGSPGPVGGVLGGVL
jgi:hypothetical protein